MLERGFTTDLWKQWDNEAAAQAAERLAAARLHEAWPHSMLRIVEGGAHALFVLSNASAPIDVAVALANVSADFAAAGARIFARDLYVSGAPDEPLAPRRSFAIGWL